LKPIAGAQIECALHGCDKFGLLVWLFEKIDGAQFHGFDCGGQVTIPHHHDPRDRDDPLDQTDQDSKAAYLRHADVHQNAPVIQIRLREKLFGAAIYLRRIARARQEVAGDGARMHVVIDYVN